MAESMLDFGKVANLAMGLSGLAIREEDNRLTAERNRITEQHYQQAADQHEADQELEAKKLKQQGAFKVADDIDKMMQHPTVATNRQAQIQLLRTKATALEQGTGVKIPMPDQDELMGGYESMDRFMKTMRTGTYEEKMAAGQDALVANPVFASKVFDDMKKVGEMTTQMEEAQLRIETNKTKLQALNQKNAKVNLQNNFYTQHVGALGSTSALATDPRYAEHIRKLQSFEQDKAKQIYLDMHPDFKDAWEKKTQSELATLPAVTDALKEEIDGRWSAINEARAKDGVAPNEMIDEVAGYESVYAARQAQAAFLADPYNRQNWKNLKAAEQNVRVLQGKAGKQISDIADQRTQIMQAKLDNKQQTGLAESTLQESFINHLNNGFDDNQALGQAIKDVRKQYPDVPFDATKILNPSKRGKSEIAIKMPSDILGANLKAVDAADSTIEYADQIMERIQANPSIVGKGAKLAASFAGAGQQLRALAGMDPAGAKFLNTKVRDDAEAFQELLVYMQAKSMDPSGALDLKVVQHARDVVGDMSGWAVGPEQIMNKLRLVKDNAARNMRRARSHIRGAQKDGGLNSYLGDEPQSSPTPNPNRKPVAEMGADEVMKELLESMSK